LQWPRAYFQGDRAGFDGREGFRDGSILALRSKDKFTGKCTDTGPNTDLQIAVGFAAESDTSMT